MSEEALMTDLKVFSNRIAKRSILRRLLARDIERSTHGSEKFCSSASSKAWD